jgi:hypothetical protein
MPELGLPSAGVFQLQFLPQIVLPQFVGVAILYLTSPRGSRVWFALVPFVVTTMYFVWSWAFWSAEADAIYETRGEPACGAFGAMMIFMIFGGALVHFVVSSVVAIFWHLIRRTSTGPSA